MLFFVILLKTEKKLNFYNPSKLDRSFYSKIRIRFTLNPNNGESILIDIKSKDESSVPMDFRLANLIFKFVRPYSNGPMRKLSNGDFEWKIQPKYYPLLSKKFSLLGATVQKIPKVE